MKLKITVHGVAYEVDVEVLDAGNGAMQHYSSPLPPMPSDTGPAAVAPATSGPLPMAAGPVMPVGSTGGVASPIAGTVLELRCKPGDQVSKGQDLLIIEAMKMETAIAAPSAGTVKAVLVAAGDNVRESQTLVEFD